ncbi:MAG TPA: type IV toxin-antitoxin system AbiEi family antitoxin domain-containing protein [Thermoanaerobaculia bacterium]|nr:type IV toxin-antitoxin system AbiEi family antitoxin domain-containing protein [Thermoanaerobaculia bacterium]
MLSLSPEWLTASRAPAGSEVVVSAETGGVVPGYNSSVVALHYLAFDTMSSTADRVLSIARNTGVVRPRDLVALGIPRQHLYRLHQDGKLVRVGWGLYALPGGEVTEHHRLVEAAKAVPKGVLCLLTAVRFHELGLQNPPAIWMAIEQKAWRPKRSHLDLEIVYLSGEAFTKGVEVHVLEGVRVRIYGPAKTVADCFRFRSRVGLDVALEALRSYLDAHAHARDDLWRFARICRVSRVMAPYLEALS